MKMVKTVEKLVNGQKLKPKRVPVLLRIFITLFFMGIVFLFAAIITYVFKQMNAAPPSSYAECIKAKGSTLQKTYPGVCVSKVGDRFIQPLSQIEQELLEAPITGDPVGQFCGGIMGKACPQGYTCKYDGNYPDAGGKCIKE